MFHRLKLINKNQRGFTLIELVVAITITALIVGGVTMAIFQVFDVNGRSTTRMTAVKQVENAVYWISRDAKMAQDVQPDEDSGFPLNLTWVEWDNTVHQITYTLENGELERNHYIDDGEPTETVVARHINPDPEMTNCQFVGGVLTFELTAALGGFRPASETRVCEVIPRPD